MNKALSKCLNGTQPVHTLTYTYKTYLLTNLFFRLLHTYTQTNTNDNLEAREFSFLKNFSPPKLRVYLKKETLQSRSCVERNCFTHTYTHSS